MEIYTNNLEIIVLPHKENERSRFPCAASGISTTNSFSLRKLATSWVLASRGGGCALNFCRKNCVLISAQTEGFRVQRQLENSDAIKYRSSQKK